MYSRSSETAFALMKDDQDKSLSEKQSVDENFSSVYLDKTIIPIDPASGLAKELNAKSSRPVRMFSDVAIKRRHRIRAWWSMKSLAMRTAIVSGIFGLVAASIPFLPEVADSGLKLFTGHNSVAVFEITNPTVHPGAPIYIRVANGINVNSEYLDVDLNGIKALSAATLDSSSQTNQWHFIPTEITQFPQEYFKKGRHKVRIGIPSQPLGEEVDIYFLSSALASTSPPQTDSSEVVKSK